VTSTISPSLIRASFEGVKLAMLVSGVWCLVSGRGEGFNEERRPFECVIRRLRPMGRTEKRGQRTCGPLCLLRVVGPRGRERRTVNVRVSVCRVSCACAKDACQTEAMDVRRSRCLSTRSVGALRAVRLVV